MPVVRVALAATLTALLAASCGGSPGAARPQSARPSARAEATARPRASADEESSLPPLALRECAPHDTRCVLDVLGSSATSEAERAGSEQALVDAIERHRARGATRHALELMRLHVRWYPESVRAVGYREILRMTEWRDEPGDGVPLPTRPGFRGRPGGAESLELE